MSFSEQLKESQNTVNLIVLLLKEKPLFFCLLVTTLDPWYLISEFGVDALEKHLTWCEIHEIRIHTLLHFIVAFFKESNSKVY